MKLINCPACNHQISSEALTCPSCGHGINHKNKDKSNKSGCGYIILLTIIGIVFMSFLGSNTEDTHKECRKKFQNCKDNRELVEFYKSPNNRLISEECKIESKKIAKFGEPEFESSPFSKFYKGDSYLIDAQAVLIDEEVKFSNGFGAKVNSKAICNYDLKNNTTSVSVFPR